LGTEAENYLRKALETNPNFAPALLEMAKLSLANRKYLSARAFLQRYESAAAPTPEALFLGLQIEQALGNGKDADAYRQKVQHQFPDSKEALRSLKSHASQQPNPTTTTR
jgi:type IV pilus assembly protein PilF